MDISKANGVWRYTDFLVNEILPSGQVVHLDDFRAPRAKRGEKLEATDKSPTKAPPEAPEPRQPQIAEGPSRVLAEPETVNRTKHKVIIRQTDEGIEEISKDEEDDVSLERPREENVPVEAKETAASGESKDGIEVTGQQTLGQPEKDSLPSTTSDWNAYAGKPARFEVGPMPSSSEFG